MPDFCFEFHFWWLVRILRREGDIDLEESSLVRGVIGAFDVSFPVSEVIINDGDLNVRFLGL